MKRRDALLPAPEGSRYWSVDLGGAHGLQWFRLPSFVVTMGVRPLQRSVRDALDAIAAPFAAKASERTEAALAAWRDLADGSPEPEPIKPLSLAPSDEVIAAMLPLHGACIGLAWHGRAYVLEAKTPGPKATPEEIEAYGLAVVDELQDRYSVLDISAMGTACLTAIAAKGSLIGEAQDAAGFSRAPKVGSSS